METITVTVAIIAIIVSAYWSYQTIKSATEANILSIEETRKIAKQQFLFQFFAEYTKRYQDLMLNMPKDLDTSSVHREDVNIFMRLYFDLCSEEHYLHEQGMIDDFVWGLWTEGIKTAMNKEKYQTAWKLQGSYYDDPSFISFMDNLIREKA